MDFQAPNPAPEKASALLNNEMLVSTQKGMVCLNSDNITSNLNLCGEEKTVTEQLANDISSQTNIASFSDATIDSDDPISSDCSAVRTPVIPPPLQQNKWGDIKPKRRGGWPKGRKRKPDFIHLPPKAPATGYNLYLNEVRKHFKNQGLAFYEITKLVGSEWSNLTLEEKQPFLLKAEEEKRRYRDELWKYRQSGSYQLYLAKKRKKRAQNNVLSESDMDATDDIDDEDNEELYCRTCDQWFHNLHNKREHLQSRLHLHAVVGDMRSELDSDYDSSTTNPIIIQEPKEKGVSEIMFDLVSAVSKRDKEANNLNLLVQEGKAVNSALSQQFASLKERETQLHNELRTLVKVEKDLESNVFDLWRVPSLFITTELSISDIEGSEYSVTE